MDTTKRLNHLKKAAIAICVALTVPACVDNDYDLSKDIEDDVTLFSKYLELPLGSDYILMRNQLDSIDGIDTTATGDYSFFKKGEITVNVTEAIDLTNAIDTKTSIDMSSNFAVTIPAGEKTLPVVTNTLDFTASKDVLRLDSAYFTEGENLLNITVEPNNFSGNDGSYAKIKVTLPKPLKIEASAGYDVKTEADGRMSFVCNNVSTTQNSPYSVKLIKGIFENSVLKNLSYDVEATIVSNGGITCSNGTGFDVNLKVGTLGFDDIWGVFDIKLDATEPFDFDMSAIWDYFDNPTDNLVFYRPYILLNTTSNISVPANMALQIAAQNTVKAPLTETSNFGMNTANGTAKLGIVSQFAGTSETIEALDINNLMNAKPGNLRITATAAALKDPTDATLQHHITLPATAKIEYTICIPFSFDEGMSITFDEEIEDVFDEDATDMLFKKDSAGLLLDIVNKLPINTKMNISFTDENNSVIHTLDNVDLPLSSDTVHVKLGFNSEEVQDARGLKFQLFTTYGGSKKIINTRDAIYLKMKMYKKGGISVE